MDAGAIFFVTVVVLAWATLWTLDARSARQMRRVTREEEPPVGHVSGDRVAYLRRQYIELEPMSGDDFEVMLDKWLDRPADQALVAVASAMVNGLSASAGTLPMPTPEPESFAPTPISHEPIYEVGRAEPVGCLCGLCTGRAYEPLPIETGQPETR